MSNEFAARSEYDLRRKTLASIETRGMAVSTELLGIEGFPDCWYVIRSGTGVIEFKCARKPVTDTALVRVPHFTDDQRKMLYRMSMNGARCWVFVRIGATHHALLEGGVAAKFLGVLPLGELCEAARKVWVGKVDESELLTILEGNNHGEGGT